MTSMTPKTPRTSMPHYLPFSRAFTLIELVVVIAIIAILTATGLVVASRVTDSSREQVTRQIMRTLDQAVESFTADRSKRVPSIYTDVNRSEFPIVDARLATTTDFDRCNSPAVSSVQLFLLATGESESVTAALAGIKGQYRTTDLCPSPPTGVSPTPLAAAEFDPPTGPYVQRERVYVPTILSTVQVRNNNNLETAQAPVLRDPWGNRIRMVHPRFQGGYGTYFSANGAGGFTSTSGRNDLRVSVRTAGVGTQTVAFRRSFRPFNPTSAAPNSIGDADEGLTAGARPYFYSPGRDRDPGTRNDNVYVNTPQFPDETRKESLAE